MTTVYKFKAYFTDAGVGTAQDPAPTCTVINMADDSKLADAQATTASTNMPGLYSYEYSGNDGLDCVAVFITTDTGCDVKQLASYVSEKITTNLNADIAGVETKLDTVDTNVDSILADTGTDGVLLSVGTGAKQIALTSGAVLLQATQTGVTIPTVTAVTNGVTLADDAITAAKFDESTAFPVKSADTGATAIARVGADSDTLETLSDQMDAIKTETAAILEDTGTTLDDLVDGLETMLTDIHDTDLPAVKADTAAILTDTGTTLDTLIKDIPTNAELATALGTADDATLAAIAGLDTKIDTIDNFLDTEVAAILADTNELQTDLTNGGRLDLLIDSILEDTAAIGTSVLAATVEGTYTVQQVLRIMVGALAGKVTGGGTTTITFRDLSDTLNLIAATVDANGNRSGVTITLE